LAESSFDLARYRGRLTTRWIGRDLEALAEVGSTSDAAWEALASGARDGHVVVADVQHRGRGRAGRVWHTAPGKGLALSILLAEGCDRRPLGILPLAAGLALARALETLAVPARLKWPNDLMVGGRKLAGILVESRTSAAGDGRPRAVVGVGVNVHQGRADFPAELGAGPAATAPTSLALEGFAIHRETMAAELLNAFEDCWVALERAGAAPILDGWSARASWGDPVRVRTPDGVVAGSALRLDPDGALVLALRDGSQARVLAGDVAPDPTPASR
jgi:BirA family biotin operon repressor/biotin-[acetyl-CoA-carboxylase] ligase